MKPLRNEVLIAELKQEKQTDSGIILTGKEERSHVALVMAIGPRVESLQVHQKVIPDWSKGRVVTVGELQGVVISEDDILGIVED
jgi:co-chaperonin GroES (HSP10)